MSNAAYDLAVKLAGDLAEDYMAAMILDATLSDGKAKAKEIRNLSDSNKDQSNKLVQEHRGNERAIFSSIYKLMDGYKGYEIVNKLKGK